MRCRNDTHGQIRLCYTFIMTVTKTKKRVGILRGGVGKHYASSLRHGGDIILHISENLSDKYQPIDILINQDHIWHLGGLPISPSDLAHRVDVVWNATHPSFSNILESLSIPSVGANSFSGTLESSKEMLREHLKGSDIRMPRFILLPVYQRDFDGLREKYAIKKAKEVFEKFPAPWIVKSLNVDTYMGIHVAKTFAELVGAIEDGVMHNTSILVEEFINGKIASVHSVNDFRGQDIYVFPIMNILGDFSLPEKEKLMDLAKNLHTNLGIEHYLKSSFVLHPRGRAYLLDVELHPDLKPFSHFSQVCESVGAKTHHVVEHILERAL